MRFLLLFATIMQFLNFAPVQTQPAILFSQNKAKIAFPVTASFSTSISSDEQITDVELFYGTDERTCSDVQALALPEFVPGKQLNISWEWEMQDSGSLPPGTLIWWQWRVSNENGDTVTSEKMTVRWIDTIHSWKVIEQDNVRIHYYNISKELANEFLTTALDAQNKLETDTGMVASGTIDLYMYENTRELRDAMLYEQSWTGGMAYPDSNKIVIGIEAEDLEWTKRTEAHELTHVLVGNYTFTCLWTTPTWLEEGLAVFAEGEPDEGTQAAFQKAKERNELLSFHILSASFSADSDRADLSYSQSYYMVNYLIEKHGREKINKLLNTLAEGKTVDDALNEVYGFDLNGFEKEWRKAVGVPEQNAAPDTEKPAVQPTEIPTMQPITGALNVHPVSTRSLLPTATLQATTANAMTDESENMGGTKGANERSDMRESNTAAIVLGMLGLMLIGVITFLILRARKRNHAMISILLFFGMAALLVLFLPVQAENNFTQSSQYPQLPTVTLTTPIPEKDGSYNNPSIGIRMKMPTYMNVNIDTTRADDTYHFRLSIDNDQVVGHLFSYPRGEGKTLQQVSEDIREIELNDLEEIKVLEDRETTMDDGSKGWKVVADARNPADNVPLRISLVTVRGYTAETTLMLFATRENYAYYENEIDELNTLIQVNVPMLYGFKRDQLLVVDGGESDNPDENDPATSISSSLFHLTFSGLVTYDANMNLIPDLAQSWDVSDDGMVYTFHLHPEAVFHNRRPVTADDVVYSWERAASRLTDSKTVMTYIGDIREVKEMHSGDADQISGLKVLDEHTLQVTLEKPVPYFLLKLTYPTSFIVDRENVEQSKTWYRSPNGTGPFRLARWDPREKILYERFDAFYGEKPKLNAILIIMYQGTGLQLYEQGMIDYTGISYSDLTRFTDPTEPLYDQLNSNPNMCTGYITMDVTQPPFDDVKVRQAFAMSLDKEDYVKVISDGGELPAKGLYPPAMPGYDKHLKGLEFEPDKARELLEESKYGSDDIPPIIFSVSGYGNSVSEGISAVTQMWEENLGIKVTIQNIDPEYYETVLDSGKHGQLISQGWCADYPDPENFADVLFHTGKPMNRGNYSNPELDYLLENARIEDDVSKRLEMYSRAEKIIVNDAPAIFWTHSNSYVLVKPYLQGYVGTPIGIPLEKYLWIDGEKFFP